MKHTKSLIVAVLLLALLLSACGQAVPAPVEVPAQEPEVVAAPQETASEAYTVQSLAATGQRPAATYVGNAPFSARFEGNNVAGSGGVVDGAYRFVATKTDGEAWHVKLESNYPSVPGHDYRVTYRFRSNVNGKIKFGDFQEFTIKAGENSVTGTYIATSGTSYLDLQLGMLPPFTIDFTEIEVEELADEVDTTDALPAPINFENETTVYERHDQGYGILFERTPDSAALNYVACSWENAIWKSRVYVRTGMTPEAGKRYRIYGTLLSDNDTEFETLLNDGEKEKGYGAMYGQHLTGGVPTVFESAVTGIADGEELVLQFSMGNIPEGSIFTLSDFHVEEIHDHYVNMLPSGFAFDKKIATGRTLHFSTPSSYTNIALPGFTFDGFSAITEDHQDGYVLSLDKKADSADVYITQAPDSGREVWKANVYAATGMTLEAGEAYRIKINVNAAEAQKCEVAYNGNSEKAYGAEYGVDLAAGSNTIEHTVSVGESSGPLTLCVRLGDTPSAAGNTFTLSNITVEKLTGSRPNVSEKHGDGLEQTLNAPGSAATLSVTQAQSTGGVWSSKMLINTGFTPEAGVRYRVSASVNSQQAFGYELLLGNNGGEKSDYGGNWTLFANAGDNTATADFTAPEGGCGELVLTFQFGNSPAANNITVSNIQVYKLKNETVTQTLTPAYPVTTETSEGYTDVKTLSLGAWEFNSDGTASTASMDNGNPKLSVTQGRNDGEGGVWSMRLQVNTGVTVETGAKYQVTATVNGTDDLGGPELLFEKSYGEADYYGRATLSGNTFSGVFSGVIDTTGKESGDLILRLQVGNCAAPNEITLSDISIAKWTDGSSSTDAKSFDVWRTDADGVLTGDGNSASLDVKTPGDADWKLTLVAHPGSIANWAHYDVSLDVAGGSGASVWFKRMGDGGDEFYASHVDVTSDSQTVTTSFDTTDGMDGNMEILVKCGTLASGSKVTVSNVAVVETRNGDVPDGSPVYTVAQLSNAEPSYVDVSPVINYSSVGYVKPAADGGYITSMEQSAGAVTYHISQAPDERHPWNVKLNVRTGFTPEADKGYRVSFDIASSKPQNTLEVFYDGNTEAAYGELGGQKLDGSQRTVSYIIAPGSSKGELSLQIRLGQTDGTDGNDYIVSNLRIDEVGFTKTTAPENKEAAYLDTIYNYSARLEKQRDRASVVIERTPSQGMEAWKNKLFVETGVKLKAGQKYRITADVKSIIPTPFEVCFNNGDVEKGLGAIFNLMASPYGQHIEYATYVREDIQLVVQLSLGKCAAPNTVILSNLKVERAGEINLVSDTIYTF